MSGQIGASDRSPKEVMKSRLRKVMVTAPAMAAVGSVTATQVIAWKLGYHQSLGQPIFGHVYWPWEWASWLQQPWAPQCQQAFQTAKGAVVGEVLLLGGLAMVSSARKPKKHDTVHGTARFATEKEVREAGLMAGRKGEPHVGLYLGAWERKGALEYMRHEGSQHLIGVGPMRSGKTLGLVVPNLVTWLGSTIVYDPKGELWWLSAGWRALEAKNIVLNWDIASPTGSVSYNFVEDCVRLGTEHEVGDMASLIEAIADPDGKGLEGHFDPTAAAALTGIALYVCYEMRAKGRTACLSDIAHALADPDRKPDVLFKAMVDNRFGPEDVRHELIARRGSSMLGKDVKERSGVLSTAERMLRLLDDPIVARNTRTCDFRISDLMDHERPVSLYIVLRDEDRLRLRPLIRLFMTRAMDRMCSVAMKPGQSPHKHKLLLMMDEFPSLGRMDTFVSSLARCPGYGIRAFLLVQDREQLLDAYGVNEPVSGKCHIRIAYAPNGQDTAEWVSELSGTATVTTEDITESGGAGKPSTSRSFHAVSRKLLNPDEVMRLKAPTRDGDRITSPGGLFVVMSGNYPILATQMLYFLDPELSRRSGLTAPAQSHTIQGSAR